MLIIALGLTLSSSLWCQQFKFDLANLESKACNSFHVSLNARLVRVAGNLLDDKAPEEAKAKTLIVRLTGIYVERLEFKNEGIWARADLDSIRN